MENKYIKKQIGFEVQNIINTHDDLLRIEAFASTFGNIDRHNDIIDRGAFDESIQQLKDDAVDTPFIYGTDLKALLPSLFQHDTDKPIGSIGSLETNEEGLLVTIVLPKEDTRVTGQIMPQLKVMSIKALSIGGFITERTVDEETGVRTILKFELMEISLVTIPANPKAIITSIKAKDNKFQELPIASLPTKWDEKAALERLEKSGFLKEASVDIDRLDEDEGKSMLIFADLIDGEINVVPRALFAGAAKLAGMKNQELLPKDKIEKCKEVLAYYYQKMGRSNPFECGFSPSELNAATCEEMKGIFRNGTRFSKAGAEYVQEAIFASSKRADESILDKGENLNKAMKEFINLHN